MNIYQILKYGTRKELFFAKDVKTLRDYIFDMILHTHVERHEGMMNDIINNSDLEYTIKQDERAKVREESENTVNNINDKQIKRRKKEKNVIAKNNYSKTHL